MRILGENVFSIAPAMAFVGAQSDIRRTLPPQDPQTLLPVVSLRAHTSFFHDPFTNAACCCSRIIW